MSVTSAGCWVAEQHTVTRPLTMWSATDFSIAACQTSFPGCRASEGSASRLCWSEQFIAKPNMMEKRCNLDSQLPWNHLYPLKHQKTLAGCMRPQVFPSTKRFPRRLLRLLRLRLLGLCLSRLGSSMTQALWQVWHLDQAVMKGRPQGQPAWPQASSFHASTACCILQHLLQHLLHYYNACQRWRRCLL